MIGFWLIISLMTIYMLVAMIIKVLAEPGRTSVFLWLWSGILVWVMLSLFWA